VGQGTSRASHIGSTGEAVLLLSGEIDLVVSELKTSNSLLPQSSRRMVELISRFGYFVSKAYEVSSLSEVRPEHARAFIEACSQTCPPAIATMYLRRSSVRLLFRIARALELCDHDPTLDLTLPAKSRQRTRPLADDEIALCRSHSAQTLHETRQPAAWALAEATATTSELPHITMCDLDLRNERVWLHDGSTTYPRWGFASPWGLEQLERRLRTLRRQPDPKASLVYEGRGSAESRTASCCIAITETLRRAGLAHEPDISPASVRGWAGRKILTDTGSIQEAARRLGVRSLDRAARLVAHDWDDNSFLDDDA
jgi:integrase/recombinase XerC